MNSLGLAGFNLPIQVLTAKAVILLGLTYATEASSTIRLERLQEEDECEKQHKLSCLNQTSVNIIRRRLPKDIWQGSPELLE